ncbi:MAG: alpha/beta fold hydrolase [Gammaproteobacteria bacterium]|nr:alpha/beta fold hydrolase [Gammaproteobacteria bacterium]
MATPASGSDRPAIKEDYLKKRGGRRKISINLRILRWCFRYLSPLLPGLGAWYAYRLWFSTRRHPAPGREQRWEAESVRSSVTTEYGEVAVYQWGNEGPGVLLIHGWNGRGTQLAGFAQPLIDAGYRVLAFDGPGHGDSPGRWTTIFRLCEATRAVVEKFGPMEAVIAHSFGGAVTAYALNHHLAVSRVVSISSPASIRYLVERFCEAMRIPGSVQQRLERRIEQRMTTGMGEDIWECISPESNARRIKGVPALIVHDHDDHDVDVSHGQRLHQAWQGSELLETRGLGHRRILRNRKTIKHVVDFISRS